MNDFERTCQEEYCRVKQFLLKLTGDAALSDELTQETFYQALKQWKRFRGQCAPGTWLCGIAKRQYFTWCRRPPPIPAGNLPEEREFTDALEDRERRLSVHRLLHSLPEPYREVVTLRLFGDLSHEEIGGLFGKSAAWARTVYYRGRQQLARMWKEENEE
ncbi:MAG: RNA polymerase sigma factor [Clostridia bacterium]|nr:RNA polymerase sigma factor [Clostridia bacterium]